MHREKPHTIVASAKLLMKKKIGLITVFAHLHFSISVRRKESIAPKNNLRIFCPPRIIMHCP